MFSVRILNNSVDEGLNIDTCSKVKIAFKISRKFKKELVFWVLVVFIESCKNKSTVITTCRIQKVKDSQKII